MMLCSVRYTENIPEGFDGIARLWFIRIRPERRGDEGLLAHEREHVRQFWTFSLFHCLAYGRLAWYTKWCEVGAYRKQLMYPPANEDHSKYTDLYAWFISTKYGLDVTKEEAIRSLSSIG